MWEDSGENSKGQRSYRDSVLERGEVQIVKWIPTQDLLADVLTKRGLR